MRGISRYRLPTRDAPSTDTFLYARLLRCLQRDGGYRPPEHGRPAAAVGPLLDKLDSIFGSRAAAAPASGPETLRSRGTRLDPAEASPAWHANLTGIVWLLGRILQRRGSAVPGWGRSNTVRFQPFGAPAGTRRLAPSVWQSTRRPGTRPVNAARHNKLRHLFAEAPEDSPPQGRAWSRGCRRDRRQSRTRDLTPGSKLKGRPAQGQPGGSAFSGLGRRCRSMAGASPRGLAAPTPAAGADHAISLSASNRQEDGRSLSTLAQARYPGCSGTDMLRDSRECASRPRTQPAIRSWLQCDHMRAGLRCQSPLAATQSARQDQEADRTLQ